MCDFTSSPVLPSECEASEDSSGEAELEAELEAEPGRGEVGGLLAVLLASLEGNKLNQYMNKTVTIKQINYND